MKKYLQFIKESYKGLYNLTEDELLEKLKYSIIERDELNQEIDTINNIISQMKSNRDDEYAKTLPENIFDFNKEQLDWIFEYTDKTTPFKKNISIRKLQDISLVPSSSFIDTDQFYFSIDTEDNIDDRDRYEDNADLEHDLHFLGNNLKKLGGPLGQVIW